MITVKTNGIKEKVVAVEHYKRQLSKIETDIAKLKIKEYRACGTAFVTLTANLSAE